MIDPNIILQSQTPLQLQGQAMSLQALQQRFTQGRQDLALGEQRQQQNALALQQQQQAAADRQALDQAMQANASSGPDGKPFIDHEGVVGTLAKTGHGPIALKYKSEIASLDNELNKLDASKLQLLSTKTTMAMQGLGAVLEAAPAQKQAVWTQALRQGYQNGLIQPGQYPEQVPDDATVQGMLWQTIVPHQQIGLRLQMQANAANQKRADAAETRAEAYQQGMLDREDANRYQFSGYADAKGHPITLDRKSGATGVNPNIVMPSGGAVAGGGVTPDASLSAQQKSQADYEKAATAEQQNLQVRNRIGQGLKANNLYVDAKGKATPFSQMKNAAGDPLSADDIGALQDQMRATYEGATAAAV